ncbi:MAG: (4Fe-4S)-binding protein [Firmicutes bacterium]|nr:(4Fe-4S)-binding protein [Bacillota bacterium]
MRISIASGKGGTGKTLVATNLALSISDQPVHLLDCDVEEPNAHVFLQGDHIDQQVVHLPIPKVNQAKCQQCSKCSDVCVFNAIALFDKIILTFDDLCHSCGACWHLCPHNAIEKIDKEIGAIDKTKVDNITLITGKLKIGNHASPPLIKKVKGQCNDGGINILDGPPGSSCPAMEAVEGTDYCVMVTEPTPFGLNDLRLAVDMVTALGVPCGVVINRDGPGNVGVLDYCREKGIKLLMQIPMDDRIAKSYAKGTPLVKEEPAYRDKFNQLYQVILGEV